MLLFGIHYNYHFLNIIVKCWCIWSVNNIFIKLEPMLHKAVSATMTTWKRSPWCSFKVIIIFSQNIATFVKKIHMSFHTHKQKIIIAETNVGQKQSHWKIWHNTFACPKNVAYFTHCLHHYWYKPISEILSILLFGALHCRPTLVYWYNTI